MMKFLSANGTLILGFLGLLCIIYLPVLIKRSAIILITVISVGNLAAWMFTEYVPGSDVAYSLWSGLFIFFALAAVFSQEVDIRRATGSWRCLESTKKEKQAS